MSIAEFREAGYLQEANRLFFHPLGLALEVVTEPCGCDGGLVEKGPAGATYSAPCDRCRGGGTVERLGGVWDYREDPEGIVFGDDMIDPAKVLVVETEMLKHAETREELLGAVIQPVPGRERERGSCAASCTPQPSAPRSAPASPRASSWSSTGWC